MRGQIYGMKFVLSAMFITNCIFQEPEPFKGFA